MVILIFLVYFFIYFVIVRLVTKLLCAIPKSKRNKRKICAACIIVAVLIPVWDVPWVNIHFYYLCRTQAGIHVYEEIMLGPEYWNKDGTLKAFEHTYYLKSIERILPKGYLLEKKSEYGVSSIARTNLRRTQIVRECDKKVIGEVIRISKGRGWLLYTIGLPRASSETTNCPAIGNRRTSAGAVLVDAIFQPY